MRVSFIIPSALGLLILLIPLWALALATPRRRATAGLWATLLLRTLLIVALVLALAGAQVVRESSELTTVFLLDRSASVAPEAQAQAQAYLRDALRAMRPGDRAAVVAFGANAVVARAPSDQRPFGEVDVTPVVTGTNIQEALQLGLALLPAETSKRLVVLSDGGENAGDARVAARLAAGQQVQLSYVDLSLPPGAAEALVGELHAPANVRAGQSFELAATIESSIAQIARLRIVGDDQVLFDQDVALQAGVNHLPPVTAQARGDGFQRYRAEIAPQRDGRAENNAAEAIVRVGGAARVLLIEGQPGEGQNLKDALAAAQVGAETIAPGALPADLNQLGAYDAVVLINVPASALPPTALTNLPAYVRDLGKGLIMVGGDRSFGVGGYGRTPIEEAMPVSMDAPNERARPTMAVIFLLDRSASMSGCHCNGPNRETDGWFDHDSPFTIDIAKQGVIQAAKALDKRDSLGVVMFDNNALVAFPVQRGPSPDDVLAAIAPIEPFGNSNLYSGMLAAEQALDQTDASIKHIVLFTDGNVSGGDTVALAQQLYGKGITLSVVGEGFGAVPYLQSLAEAGGGRYIQVASMQDVPQIFLQEAVNTSSKYLVEHPFTPQYAATSPILKGLEAGLPQLYGYNGTTAKQTATTALVDADGSPVLAHWQYGLGRAVAWTSDATGKWAKDWVGWPEFPRFAAQLVGWALPSPVDSGLVVDLHNQGAATTIDVTAQDRPGLPRDSLDMRAAVVAADGSRQEVTLAQLTPGSYRATIASPPQGTYMVQVAGSQGGRVVAQETAGLVIPYPAEYRLGQSNPALLADLAAIGGGARLQQPAEAFAHDLPPARHAQEIALPLLLLVLALLPIDIALRRLMVYRRTIGRAA